MLTECARFIRSGSLIVGLFLLVLLLLPAQPIDASGPFQDGGTADVIIDDQQCTFWLDFDDDGEGDTEIDTGPNDYAYQETPVVGSCEFKLNTPDEATLLLETELVEWRSEVEIVREPGLPERKVLQPGKVTIPGLAGGMKITVQHKGRTPRSGKTRALRDGYEHQVQTPRSFRLLEIIVTTPAGKYDRLETNATSASGAYIDTHRRVFDQNSRSERPRPEEITALASELLDEGYPEVANRLLDVDVASVDNGGTNWWLWVAIVLIVVIAIVVASLIIIKFNQSNSPDASPIVRPQDNM